MLTIAVRHSERDDGSLIRKRIQQRLVQRSCDALTSH